MFNTCINKVCLYHYHSLGIFSRRQIDDNFLIFFPQKIGIVKAKEKNKKNISKCRLLKFLPRVPNANSIIFILLDVAYHHDRRVVHNHR